MLTTAAALAVFLGVAFASPPPGSVDLATVSGSVGIAAAAAPARRRRRTTRSAAVTEVPRAVGDPTGLIANKLSEAAAAPRKRIRRRARVRGDNLPGRVEAKPAPSAAAASTAAEEGEGSASSGVGTRAAAATERMAADATTSRAAEEEIVDISEGKHDAAASAPAGAKAGAAPGPSPPAEDGAASDEATNADSVVDLNGDDKEGGSASHSHPGGHDGKAKQEEGDEAERCVPVGECEQCPGRTKRTDAEEGCAETGRRQRFECIVSSGEEEIKRYKVYHSCRRTVADEEFLMMRMQVICVLMGALSVLSVRRQKRASASLFDQRRRIGGGGGSGGNSRVVYTSVPQGGPAENGGAAPAVGGGGGAGGADDLSVSTSGTTGVEMV